MFDQAPHVCLHMLTNLDRQTYAWDVRTKRVTCDQVPTLDGIVAITNYGPTATLFTMGRNHTVQQYDINPQGTPTLVANVQHVPANTPPSPPNSIDDKKLQADIPRSNTSTPAYNIETSSSEGEGVAMSPLQKIAQEMDALEDERRDNLGPLSPTSSRASLSSRSSGNSRRRYRFDKASSRGSNGSVTPSEGTVFSFGSSIRSGHESVSIRSLSSAGISSHRKASSLRKEVLKRPPPSYQDGTDLFPHLRARLPEVAFRSPRYSSERTVDELRQQMIEVVFGWEGEAEDLVRDECK
jgi:hypothetical protein